MFSRYFRHLGHAGLFVLWLALASFPAWGEQGYADGEVIVKLKSTGGKHSQETFAYLGKAISQKGMVLKNSWDKINMFHFAVKPGQSVEAAVDEIMQDPEVEYAEPNYYLEKASETGIIETFSVQEVEALSGGSYLATGAPIQATDTWGILSAPPPTPVIAVIDTGVDTNHDVFADSGAIWTNSGEIAGNGIDDDGNGYVDDVNGWNFVNNTGTMYDDDGHGTHVAGIILGVTQDIYSAPFASSNIKIMPLKFLDGNGIGKTSDAIKAIYYAVDNGAKVLNNSWGGPSYSSALHEAVAYSYDKRTSFVVAAGNAGSSNDSSPMYPANYDVPNVISIAATTDADALASFSNYGSSSVHLGSPGVFILSTVPGGFYGSSSGTSMSAPFVAGVAALIKIEQPEMNGYQLKGVVMDAADGVSSLSNKVSTDGRLNVLSSVQLAKNTQVDPFQPAYSYSNGDRELASNLATGGGCGTVAKMYNDIRKNGGKGPGGAQPWAIFLVVGLLILPLVILARVREKDGKNRRAHERFNIDSSVRVKVGDRELVGSVSTISLGGVQLNTDALLEQGGIVKMQIAAPDGSGEIQVEGRVVWSEERKAYGVQFAETKDSVIDTITDWTKSLSKAS